MHTGMLWLMSSGRTLQENVLTAIDYYVKKYGMTPNLCLLHPSNETKDTEFPITVRPYRPILPGHLWIGVEQGKEKNS